MPLCGTLRCGCAITGTGSIQVDGSGTATNPFVISEIGFAETTLNDISNVAVPTPASGDTLVFDGTNWVNRSGFRFLAQIVYTSGAVFLKDNPLGTGDLGVRAVRVRVQAGGGGGGGVNAASSRTSFAAGGGGGGYGESFLLASAVGTSETVTVGAGGAGGAAGSNNGAAGGASSFGALVAASGGAGGGAGVDATGILGAANFAQGGADGGAVTAGQIQIRGNPAGLRHGNGSTAATGGNGGASVLGAGGLASVALTNTSVVGAAGRIYGGGGSGAASANITTSRAGGNGAPGIVIVEVFA
jgi:hypothetical protein